MENSVSTAPAAVASEPVPQETPIEVKTVAVDTNKEETVTQEDKVSAETNTQEWSNATTFKGASFLSTVINTINTVIGAAIISIAYSIQISGVWGAIVLVIAVLVPSLITSYYMSCATVYTNEDIYGKIGEKLTNKVVGVLANISLMVLDFGIDVAYMNVLFNQIVAIGRDVFDQGPFFEKYKIIISLIVTILILFPLCSIKTMDALQFTSGIAVVSIFLFVITCIVLGIKGFAKRGWDLNGWPQSLPDLSTSFAVFVLCFCSHVNTSKLTSELRFKQGKSKYATRVKKTFRATTYAYIVCALSYMFVGICGYAAYGSTIKDSILDNMEGSFFWYIRIAYGLVVMFSYPILGYPACITIDAFIFKSERTATRRYIEGFIWTILTFVVCVAIPSVSKIFGITGNTCGVLLTFIWPSIYFIAMYREEQKKPVDMKSNWFKPKHWELIVAWIILILGILVCIWATSMEVMKLVNP